MQLVTAPDSRLNIQDVCFPRTTTRRPLPAGSPLHCAQSPSRFGPGSEPLRPPHTSLSACTPRDRTPLSTALSFSDASYRTAGRSFPARWCVASCSPYQSKACDFLSYTPHAVSLSSSAVSQTSFLSVNVAAACTSAPAIFNPNLAYVDIMTAAMHLLSYHAALSPASQSWHSSSSGSTASEL